MSRSRATEVPHRAVCIFKRALSGGERKGKEGDNGMKAVLANLAVTALARPARMAPAGATDQQSGWLLQRRERERDGVMDCCEARRFPDAPVWRWRRRGCGVVSADEMDEAAQGCVAQRVAKLFATMDGNGDGRSEHSGLGAKGFAHVARTDADGDGSLSIERVRSRWQARRDGGTSVEQFGN